MKKQRGYCGIAFWQPKDKENVGTVFRNAHAFGADFIAVIGARVEYRQASNTTRAEKHVPVFHYTDMDDFLAHIPLGCDLIPVEVDGEDIKNFVHPERAIYLFGGEDRTLPEVPCKKRLSIETDYCLNMATTSAIVLFSRSLK